MAAGKSFPATPENRLRVFGELVKVAPPPGWRVIGEKLQPNELRRRMYAEPDLSLRCLLKYRSQDGVEATWIRLLSEGEAEMPESLGSLQERLRKVAASEVNVQAKASLQQATLYNIWRWLWIVVEGEELKVYEN